MRYFFITSLTVVCAMSLANYITAADDFLQKQLRERAKWSQAISRISEMIEAAEADTVYTENPPKLVITINNTNVVTVEGAIAQRAYEMAQHKKNLPPSEELLAMMNNFFKLDEKSKDQ